MVSADEMEHWSFEKRPFLPFNDELRKLAIRYARRFVDDEELRTLLTGKGLKAKHPLSIDGTHDEPEQDVVDILASDCARLRLRVDPDPEKSSFRRPPSNFYFRPEPTIRVERAGGSGAERLMMGLTAKPFDELYAPASTTVTFAEALASVVRAWGGSREMTEKQLTRMLKPMENWVGRTIDKILHAPKPAGRLKKSLAPQLAATIRRLCTHLSETEAASVAVRLAYLAEFEPLREASAAELLRGRKRTADKAAGKKSPKTC
jgi:hypothetical protein